MLRTFSGVGRRPLSAHCPQWECLKIRGPAKLWLAVSCLINAKPKIDDPLGPSVGVSIGNPAINSMTERDTPVLSQGHCGEFHVRRVTTQKKKKKKTGWKPS